MPWAESSLLAAVQGHCVTAAWQDFSWLRVGEGGSMPQGPSHYIIPTTTLRPVCLCAFLAGAPWHRLPSLLRAAPL